MIDVLIRNKVHRLHEVAPYDPARHRLDGFDCGVDDFNSSFTRHLRQQNPGDIGLVVTDEKNSVKAFVIASRDEPHPMARFTETGTPMIEISCLAVARKFQGTGLGKELLAATYRHFNGQTGEPAARFIWASVDKDHADGIAAQQFYERLGFAYRRRVSVFWQMALDLSAGTPEFVNAPRRSATPSVGQPPARNAVLAS